jgi:hypothetical protein
VFSVTSNQSDETRLSQMILDQVFFGVLNENKGTLEVYDEPVEDVSYGSMRWRISADIRSSQCIRLLWIR